MTYDVEIFHILQGEHILVLQALKQIKSFVTLTYVIPQIRENQIPIFFEVSGDFIDYKIVHDKTSYGFSNDVIKFRLPSKNQNGTWRIHFNYSVLVNTSKSRYIPRKMSFHHSDNLPEDVKYWLRSSESIQSKNIFILLVSRFFKAFSNDMLWFVKKIMYWTAYHGFVINFLKQFWGQHPFTRRLSSQERYWLRLEDAVSALFFGSLCPGEANLQAALLRSMGVPARVLIVTSVFYGKKYWMDGQHYIIEFYCPDYGWVMAQSGKVNVPPRDDIILRVLSLDDENQAGNGLSKYGGMAPWFWLDNTDVCFGIAEEFNTYKLSSSEKKGFPIVRGWKEKKLKLEYDVGEKIFELFREIWRIFIKKAGTIGEDKKTIFEKAYLSHKQAINSLIKTDFNDFLKKMNETKKEYMKL